MNVRRCMIIEMGLAIGLVAIGWFWLPSLRKDAAPKAIGQHVASGSTEFRWHEIPSNDEMWQLRRSQLLKILEDPLATKQNLEALIITLLTAKDVSPWHVNEAILILGKLDASLPEVRYVLSFVSSTKDYDYFIRKTALENLLKSISALSDKSGDKKALVLKLRNLQSDDELIARTLHEFGMDKP